jgi:protein tyrosine/serine phosphatase
MGEEKTSTSSAAPARGRMRKRAWIALGSVCACVALAVFLWPALQNIQVVVPGSVYSSAQLSPQRLEELIATHHIKAVLNLRGAHAGSAWYEEEVALAARLGVQHTDFGLSAVRDVTPLVAEQLVQVMAAMPKPLLIHCYAGADRSGFASALYRYALMHDTSDKAASQLSFLHGHIPLFRRGTGAMDRSFLDYVNSHPQPTTPPSRKP